MVAAVVWIQRRRTSSLDHLQKFTQSRATKIDGAKCERQVKLTCWWRNVACSKMNKLSVYFDKATASCFHQHTADEYGCTYIVLIFTNCGVRYQWNQAKKGLSYPPPTNTFFPSLLIHSWNSLHLLHTHDHLHCFNEVKSDQMKWNTESERGEREKLKYSNQMRTVEEKKTNNEAN